MSSFFPENAEFFSDVFRGMLVLLFQQVHANGLCTFRIRTVSDDVQWSNEGHTRKYRHHWCR